MRLKLLSITTCLFASQYATAVNVGDITSIINANESMLAKEVANTTDVARYVGLKIFRISSPLPNGKVIPMESNAEILSTPANLVLPGSAKDIFKIIYQGPSDNVERYYRLSWTDQPIVNADHDDADKGAEASTSAQINTILVVAPRQEKFEYQFQNGAITNTGNVSFRVVAAGTCVDPKKDIEHKGCRERYYVMPHTMIKLKHVDTKSSKSHVGVWHNDKYVNIKSK
jgi:Mat/Ecp fimbriae periplasmic chaperone